VHRAPLHFSRRSLTISGLLFSAGIPVRSRTRIFRYDHVASRT
jgi:hypothetical protein